MIHAPNRWAVQTLERILVVGNGYVNPTMKIVGVFRNTGNVGIRDSLLREISYPEFITSVVAHSHLVEDPVTSFAFSKSLEDPTLRKEALQSLKRLDMAEPPRAVNPFEVAETEPESNVIPFRPRTNPEQSAIYQQAMAALTDLGYKKPQTKQVLATIDNIEEMAIEEVIKISLQRLAG